MMKRKALMTLGIVLLLFCFWYFHLRVYRENKLIDEGNVMVKKIENFKNKNNRLPQSLEEIGMKEKDGANFLDYNIDRDGINYRISFIMSIDHSKIYYSDSKKWEDYYRDMRTASDTLE